MVALITKMGAGVVYAEDFCPGAGFECGHNVIIESGVTIGNNVKIGNFVLLKKGTVIEDDVFIDSYVISSGDNYIGRGSQIRYQSIVARNVQIGRNVFLCAGVKTAYLDHARKGEECPLVIGDHCFIGDNSTILAGKTLAEGIVVGAHTLVTKDLDMPWTIYAGCPARAWYPLTEGEKDVIRKGLR